METTTKKKLIGDYPILTRSDWIHQGLNEELDNPKCPESVDGIIRQSYNSFQVKQALNIHDQKMYWVEGRTEKNFEQDWLRVPLQYFKADCDGDLLYPADGDSLVILHPTGEAKCFYLAGADIVNFFKKHHGIHDINIGRPKGEIRENPIMWQDLDGKNVWGRTCFKNFVVTDRTVIIHRLTR